MPAELSALKIIDSKAGCVFAVKVVAGSSRSGVVGTLGEALKVALATPAQKGAANKSLVKVLARHFQLRSSQIQIMSGHTQPRKQILIRGLTSQQLGKH